MARFSLLLSFAILLASGCIDHGPMQRAMPNPTMGSTVGAAAPASGGELGATTGGVKDMGLARSLVSQGRVPPAEAFAVEAMFAEHDLPVEGAPCSSLLCLRAVLGVAPDAAGQSTAWVQVGLSSTLDPATYERPSLTLVATVDVSGSMYWSYENGGTPADLARSLLEQIVPRLGAEDRVALVAFGSTAQVMLPLTRGDEQDAILAAVAGLQEAGSTAMEAGLELAYPLAATAVGETGEVRVLVLSDYNPNVGATEPGAFRTQVASASEAGVGTTLLGLGVGLAPEVQTAMADLRGANAFSVMTPADASELMAESWPWMACPLAHDLRVTLRPLGDLHLAAAYGFPGEAGDLEPTLEVATVFLSQRRGAMLVGLLPDDGADLGPESVAVDLAYVTPEGEARAESLGLRYEGGSLDARGQYLPQTGLARTLALALLVTGMHDAAGVYAADRDAAVATLEAALSRFRADAASIGPSSLDAEVAFGEALLSLMRAGAPQGNLYGEGF